MIDFLKNHWKLVLIAIGAIVLLGWIGSVTGTNGKLYNMLVDQIASDKDKVINDQAAFIKDCEDEITKLAEEKALSDAEVAKREGTIRDLEAKLHNITVSSDPGAVITDLQRHGVRIRIRNR